MPLTITIYDHNGEVDTRGLFDFLSDWGVDCVPNIDEAKREALEELWSDVRKARRDARTLTEMNPSFATSYAVQLTETERRIANQVLALKIPGVRRAGK